MPGRINRTGIVEAPPPEIVPPVPEPPPPPELLPHVPPLPLAHPVTFMIIAVISSSVPLWITHWMNICI